MSRRFDKSNELSSPATQTAIIRSPGTKCIIYNPQPTLSSQRMAPLLKQWRTPTTTVQGDSPAPPDQLRARKIM